MLLDPSSAASASVRSPSKPWVRRKSRKPPLTPAQAVRADARTAAILERAGIDYRPAQETDLVALATGAVYTLTETLERPIFAAQARRSAAEMALTFDAFAQVHDLGNLRLVGLRPGKGKARPGALAQALATFSKDYNRRVGPLVTAGTIRPVLTVVHIRYDVGRGLWDIHAHALWDVDDDKLDAMWMGLGATFADKWNDDSRIKQPGAAANYCLSRRIDHREIVRWPEAAILELWHLPRMRLMRPAGAFRAFRSAIKGKVIRRDGSHVVVEERPDPGPRRKAAKRPGPTVQEGRVVAIRNVRVAGEKTLCAVVKRPRKARRRQGGTNPTPFSDVVPPYLAYGEYRDNSSSVDPTPARAVLPSGVVARGAPLASSPRKVAKAILHVLPPRKAWMLAVWPLGPHGQLPKPIIRRLARRAAGTFNIMSRGPREAEARCYDRGSSGDFPVSLRPSPNRFTLQEEFPRTRLPRERPNFLPAHLSAKHSERAIQQGLLQGARYSR